MLATPIKCSKILKRRFLEQFVVVIKEIHFQIPILHQLEISQSTLIMQVFVNVKKEWTTWMDSKCGGLIDIWHDMNNLLDQI
jgi:hypothetical protein